MYVQPVQNEMACIILCSSVLVMGSRVCSDFDSVFTMPCTILLTNNVFVGSVCPSSLCTLEIAERYVLIVELISPCCCIWAANIDTMTDFAGSLNVVCIFVWKSINAVHCFWYCLLVALLFADCTSCITAV